MKTEQQFSPIMKGARVYHLNEGNEVSSEVLNEGKEVSSEQREEVSSEGQQSKLQSFDLCYGFDN